MLKRLTYLAVFSLFILSPGLSSAQTRLETNGTDFTQVAEKAIPAVVSIQAKASTRRGTLYFRDGRPYQPENPMDPFGSGFLERFFGQRGQRQPQVSQASGFIVSEDGYILTNAHVVKDAGEIKVMLNDRREFDGEIVGVDPNTDVALIKIEATNLPHLSLADSENLKVGQWVVAIGNPLGLQASLTVGVVSAKGRNNLDIARIEDFIQTDAAINRGNSGGPLLNLRGDVIGMNTAIVANLATGGYMGIGFAIPSNIANHVMEQLLQTGSVSRGFMGVALQRVDHDLAQAFGLSKAEGALISDVAPESPAEEAGLRQGDIVTKYNNRRVTNIGSLRNAVSLMKPGTQINLTIVREGREITLPLTVGEFPDGQLKAAETQDKLGIEVQNLTPEVARNLGYTDIQGVVVSKVNPGSAAALAGIQTGALIVTINQQEVTSVEDFREILKTADPNRPILLLIKQGEFMQYVSIKTN